MFSFFPWEMFILVDVFLGAQRQTNETDTKKAAWERFSHASPAAGKAPCIQKLCLRVSPSPGGDGGAASLTEPLPRAPSAGARGPSALLRGSAQPPRGGQVFVHSSGGGLGFELNLIATCNLHTQVVFPFHVYLLQV